jgi:hypothetical protein
MWLPKSQKSAVKIIIDVAAAQFALVLNPNYIKGDATVSRTYSVLSLTQLQALYRNTTGFVLYCTDYNACLQTCKNLAIRLLTAKGECTYDLEKESG